MQFHETFKTIKDEGFSEEVALVATMMLAIHVKKKVLPKHLKTKGRFECELMRTFRKEFRDHKMDVAYEAEKVWEVWYDYDTQKAMNGLGGAKFQTLRQLMAKRRAYLFDVMERISTPVEATK